MYAILPYLNVRDIYQHTQASQMTCWYGSPGVTVVDRRVPGLMARQWHEGPLLRRSVHDCCRRLPHQPVRQTCLGSRSRTRGEGCEVQHEDRHD